MKKFLALLMMLVCGLSLAGCDSQEQEEKPKEPESVSEENAVMVGEISNSAARGDFELVLYADKASYTTDEEIHIRATLEYKGEQDSVTIWHGNPYLTFSITDGKDFETGGMVLTILTSTELEKGRVYEFAYQKSGGFSEDDPNADFWREFYQEAALRLPAGTYTVSANSQFSLSQERPGDQDGPSVSLQITVS